MTSRSLVPFLDQIKSREEGKDQKCTRRRVKQIAALIVVLVIALTCAILSAPNVTAPLKVRRIPARYTHSENLAPEDRELLKDVRTSFVPTGSIALPTDEELQTILLRNGEEPISVIVTEDDLTSGPLSDLKDSFVSGSGDSGLETLDDGNTWAREKRETTGNSSSWRVEFVKYPLALPNESDGTRDEDLEEYDEDNIKGHVEEDNKERGFQSFWKGGGDKESIRKTQSDIMQQYMDVTADPCTDFYQYACGNWALKNPIPADKAGFNTFEMLRENLDIVLKELLMTKTACDDGKSINRADRVNGEFENNHLKTETLHADGHQNNDCGEIKQRTKRENIKMDSSEKIPKLTSRKPKTGILKKLKQKQNLSRPKRSFVKTNDAELKAKYLYESCMNYEILEKRGSQPLLDLLEKLGGWPVISPGWNASKFDWLELMAKLRLYNNDILISEWVGPDIKNSNEFVIQLDQTSLGLPTRDYFLQASNNLYLEAYKNYLIKISILLGSSNDNAVKNADELINFEIQLAKITSTTEERRNITELYRRLTIQELKESVPNIDWLRYLDIVLNKTNSMNQTVVIFALKYMQDLVQLIEQTEPRIVANYLLWRFVRHRVNNLDDRFQEEKQKFYYILFGREQSPSRWKTCVLQVNTNMGMALGSMFVKKYFDENSKNDTLIMTKEIQNSFSELLNMTTWIDDDTKVLAKEKVDSMMLKIGYPSFIVNSDELNERYKEVELHPDTYFENTLNILRHLSRTEQSRLGQTVNKTVWNTPPAVINAYYSRNKNQIMFPAGILQPPFYHRYFPRSLNYGGIGVVIGHEITHGFDDKGRLFDKHGNLHRWWQDVAIDMFHKKAKCLIDQYGLYTVSEVSMSLDGINTQGENIADNGGIKQAFRAYKYWLEKNGNQEETLPGLNATSTQLFFLNFAQIWCGSMRPEAMKNKLKIAVHSPGQFRVIGTLSNSEDFAKEYNCPPGSPMNPTKKCNVW